jgi:hypothetical protein
MKTTPLALVAFSALILTQGCKPNTQQAQVASAIDADTPDDRGACVALFNKGEFAKTNMQFEFSIPPEFKKGPNGIASTQATRNYGTALQVDVLVKRFEAGGWKTITPERLHMVNGSYQENVRFTFVEEGTLKRELRMVPQPDMTPYQITVDFGTERVAAQCPTWDDSTSRQPQQ